jgi:arabinoxylan arabinofuranohydrolase
VAGVTGGHSYVDAKTLTLGWTATDGQSGVASVTATLDGVTVQPGKVALASLPLGQHSLVVTATDKAGNVTTQTVPFSTKTSVAGMRKLVRAFSHQHAIRAGGRGPLLSALHRAAHAHGAKARIRALKSFRRASSKLAKHSARPVLRRDAKAVIHQLR